MTVPLKEHWSPSVSFNAVCREIGASRPKSGARPLSKKIKVCFFFFFFFFGFISLIIFLNGRKIVTKS